MKKLLLLTLFITLCACAHKTGPNDFSYNQMPFKNYNFSVLGFGAYTVTIDKNFEPEPTVYVGTRTIYTYQDKQYPKLSIKLTVDEGDEFELPAESDILFVQKKWGRLNTIIHKSDSSLVRTHEIQYYKEVKVSGDELMNFNAMIPLGDPKKVNLSTGYGVTVLKWRDVGNKKIYVEYKTSSNTPFTKEENMSHLIALFDNSIKMKNNAFIQINAPPCPFMIFEKDQN